MRDEEGDAVDSLLAAIAVHRALSGPDVGPAGVEYALEGYVYV